MHADASPPPEPLGSRLLDPALRLQQSSICAQGEARVAQACRFCLTRRLPSAPRGLLKAPPPPAELRFCAQGEALLLSSDLRRHVASPRAPSVSAEHFDGAPKPRRVGSPCPSAVAAFAAAPSIPTVIGCLTGLGPLVVQSSYPFVIADRIITATLCFRLIAGEDRDRGRWRRYKIWKAMLSREAYASMSFVILRRRGWWWCGGE
ncbi:hypothetical protein NL676_024239 [Syzygium grande]|nr:hypothetical protein NL676_024239 [Syzygium grande]